MLIMQKRVSYSNRLKYKIRISLRRVLTTVDMLYRNIFIVVSCTSIIILKCEIRLVNEVTYIKK